MGVVAGCITPHPPIIVEEVGGAMTARVASTVDAMRRLAERLKSHEPDAIVIMSPHSVRLPLALPVRIDTEMQGSFAAFRAPEVRFHVMTDTVLAREIIDGARAADLPVEPVGQEGTSLSISMYGDELDHGVMVPLYFLRNTLEVRLVNLGMAFLDYEAHYVIGKVVHEAAERADRRIVFVASGDLSHRLTKDAPAGFNPRGAELDRAIVDSMREQDFEGLRSLDPELVEAGGECGLRSIITLTGCFDGRKTKCDVMSYEGPFGVGYLVASVEPAA